MHILNRSLFYIECLSFAIALIFGVLWMKSPTGPYEPITFISILVGSTLVELIRRHLPTLDNNVPYNILEAIEPNSPKERVKEILGVPHRISDKIWQYRFKEALIEISFYENNAVKTTALALTTKSPKRGFAIPMFDKPLGHISFGDFGRELTNIRLRTSLRTSELLLETRVGPSGAWLNITFGALSPLTPGVLAEVIIPSSINNKVTLSEAAKININWVAVSGSSDEEWFDWSLAISFA